VITLEFDRLGLRNGYRILDIGCGTGRHSAEAFRHPGVVAIGADVDWADICEAKSRLQQHEKLGEHAGSRWALAGADILALPFKDGSFQLVICSEVLEHIQDHHQALAEAARVLQPGQLLAVSVPSYWPEKLCWKLSKQYARESNGHIRIYRKKKLMNLLHRAGVTPFASHRAHGLHAPFWWLKCLVGPARSDHPLVQLYHRLLVWDMMKKPKATHVLERLLNPVMGKSLVIYCRKEV
jgi:ubiquinone/menaquinone biosynthesis C-methylase UbiE